MLSFVQRLIITSLQPVNLDRCKFFFFASFWLVLNNSQRVQRAQTALWSVLFFLIVEKNFLQWALLWGRQSILHITCDRTCNCWCYQFQPTIDPHNYVPTHHSSTRLCTNPPFIHMITNIFILSNFISCHRVVSQHCCNQPTFVWCTTCFKRML